MSNKYGIVSISSFLLCLGALSFSSCAKEDVSAAMDEKVLISGIDLKVSQKLPLLINTDTLIAYEVSPEEAYNKDIVWKSTDENIATVSETGRIVARRVGTAVISAMPKIGYAVTSTIEVEVIDRIICISDIVLKNKPEDLSIVATSSVQLEWETVPQAPTYNTLVWESLTPEIASVSETGLVKGLKPGEAKIKVTSMDPDRFSKEFTITVTPVIPITKISFEGVRTEFGYGEVAKLDVKIEPSNATLTALKWESNNQNIVAFDENGILTVKNTGNVMVTASASYEDGTSVSGSVELQIPSGKINEEFDYGMTWKVDDVNGENLQVKDGHLIVTPVLQKEYDNGKTTSVGIIHDGDLKFNAVQYPIFAVKFKVPKDIYDASKQIEYYLDMWTKNQTPAGKYGENVSKGNRQMTYYYAGEDYHIYYADFTAKPIGTSEKLPESEITMENVVFEWWKIWLEPGQSCNLEIDWIKTFKSVDELKALAPEQN